MRRRRFGESDPTPPLLGALPGPSEPGISRPAIVVRSSATAVDSFGMRDDASATAFYERHQERLQRQVSRYTPASPETVEDACAYAWLQWARLRPDQSRAWRGVFLLGWGEGGGGASLRGRGRGGKGPPAARPVARVAVAVPCGVARGVAAASHRGARRRANGRAAGVGAPGRSPARSRAIGRIAGRARAASAPAAAVAEHAGGGADLWRDCRRDGGLPAHG